MRGKEKEWADLWGHYRITPAYAGKSDATELYAVQKQDHPRVCGEKLAGLFLPDGLPGSPPRMRGKERGSTSRQRRNGITPAYAGKSPLQFKSDGTNEDHPRVCGEK